jgi:acylphosphatase
MDVHDGALMASPATPTATLFSLSRIRVFVEGKVQGVYYRETTRLKATSLGITGRAWNLADKRVEIVAEGQKERLEKLVEWCWKGPEGAAEVGMTDPLTKKRMVKNVTVEWVVDEQPGAERVYAEFANGGKK